MNQTAMAFLAAAIVICLLLAGSSESDPYEPQAGSATPFRYCPPLPAGTGPVVVAVGDMVCRPGAQVTATSCRDAEAADPAHEYDPAYVFALGDEQYGDGGLADYRDAYAKTWGRFKKITRPVPGNHRYETPGYFSYFRGQTQPPGYYAFDVGRWRVYALNDNCTKIDCDAELDWLDRDMGASPRRCTAIMLHHPLHASGLRPGSNADAARPFWRVALRHRADLALAGHMHQYERLRPMGSPAR